MSLLRRYLLAAILLFSGLTAVYGQEWKSVKGTRLGAISGIAFISQNGLQTRYFVVHDCKQLGETRLAIVTDEPGKAPTYEAIAWPDSNPPVDTEGISSMPGADQTFVLLSSSGKLWHVAVDLATKKLQVIKAFILPNIPAGSNFEGISFQIVNGNLIAAWGHRGQDSQPGAIYWGIFDPVSYTFISTGSDSFKVPYPLENIRHISDLKLDPLGVLYVTSATDTGDDGPFQSAFYVAGVISTWDKEVIFRKNRALSRVMQFKYHKVEALDIVPGANGGFIFGSDDENMGGWIYPIW